jgi:hypothetical protein
MKRNDLQILDAMASAGRYVGENISSCEKLLKMLEASPADLNLQCTFSGQAGPMEFIQRKVEASQKIPQHVEFVPEEIELLRRFVTYRKERLEKALAEMKVRIG